MTLRDLGLAPRAQLVVIPQSDVQLNRQGLRVSCKLWCLVLIAAAKGWCDCDWLLSFFKSGPKPVQQPSSSSPCDTAYPRDMSDAPYSPASAPSPAIVQPGDREALRQRRAQALGGGVRTLRDVNKDDEEGLLLGWFCLSCSYDALERKRKEAYNGNSVNLE